MRLSRKCEQDSKLDVRIKWPNDIYANKLKIGGILCQSVYRDGVFHLIIGSGLNVNNAEPTTCLASMISQLTGKDVAAAGGISREVRHGAAVRFFSVAMKIHGARAA